MTGSRDSIIEDTADFPRRTDRRGPLAAAASMAVLVVGAAFLTFSIASPPPKKTTAQATPQPSEISVKVAPSAQAPDTAIETVQLAAVELPKPPKPIAISVEEALAKSRAARSKTAPVAGKPSEDERDGFTPRLKPTLALAKPGADENRAPEEKAKTQNSNAKVAEHKNQERSLTRPIRFGGVFLASDADRPGPIFFESDVRRRVYARAPAPITFAADQTRDVAEARIKVSKGETFVDALKRAGVAASDRNEAAFAFGKEYNLRRLQPGQEFALTLAWPNQTLFQMAAAKKEPEARLLALDFSIDPQNRIAVRRDKDGALAAEKSAVELTARTMAISGSINGSLFLSAKAQGAPNQTIADLANIFAYDIDFQREIFGGDEYEAIFDVYYDDEGRVVSAGDIHFARMKWRGRTKEKAYYRFASANGGARADYYDAAGQSAKRLLMKTPIDGARLSSGFGTRRHPISGYRKQHKGVDFAARRGTPVYAAGDGVIERANRFGSFGNYVRIRHANGYKTAYAHLKGFRKGIRKGKRVEQGDVIAYVGSTGASTGPHLHYEVHLNGKAVNPQKLKIATGVKLKGAELKKFNAARDDVNAMRLPPDEGTGLFARKERDDNAL